MESSDLTQSESQLFHLQCEQGSARVIEKNLSAGQGLKSFKLDAKEFIILFFSFAGTVLMGDTHFRP